VAQQFNGRHLPPQLLHQQAWICRMEFSQDWLSSCRPALIEAQISAATGGLDLV
jgi:hypothetical protein